VTESSNILLYPCQFSPYLFQLLQNILIFLFLTLKHSLHRLKTNHRLINNTLLKIFQVNTRAFLRFNHLRLALNPRLLHPPPHLPKQSHALMRFHFLYHRHQFLCLSISLRYLRGLTLRHKSTNKRFSMLCTDTLSDKQAPRVFIHINIMNSSELEKTVEVNAELLREKCNAWNRSTMIWSSRQSSSRPAK
jgi:serine/threonine protein phosphatase PrpC